MSWFEACECLESVDFMVPVSVEQKLPVLFCISEWSLKSAVMNGTEFLLASVRIFSSSGCKISFWFFRDIFVGDFGLASWLILTPSDSAVVTPPTASCCCWITEADCADGCDEDGDT